MVIVLKPLLFFLCHQDTSKLFVIQNAKKNGSTQYNNDVFKIYVIFMLKKMLVHNVMMFLKCMQFVILMNKIFDFICFF